MVTGRELRQATEPTLRLQPLRLAELETQAPRRALEQSEVLSEAERRELDAQGETPKRRRIERLEAVGGAQEDAAEGFHAHEQLVDLGDLEAPLGSTPVTQHALGLVQQQHAVALPSLVEHLGDRPFGAPDILVEQVARGSMDQLAAEHTREPSRKRRLARARWPIQANAAFAL